MIKFVLSYDGNDADNHQIDFYDVSQAMIGFQRSLAITTHLVLNGQVITQAPSLKNARIIASPPKEGSWEIIATILAGTYALGTAPQSTPLGHLIYSAYDYVVSEYLGFHVDYEQSLGQQYEKLKSSGADVPILDQSRFDSAMEKCEKAIQDMHRPIFATETASSASISKIFNGIKTPISTSLDINTYGFIKETIQDDSLSEYSGRVSSFNANTNKGRIYAITEKRPIPFILSDRAKTAENQIKLAESLATNVRSRFQSGEVTVSGYKLMSKMGHLKGVMITNID